MDVVGNGRNSWNKSRRRRVSHRLSVCPPCLYDEQELNTGSEVWTFTKTVFRGSVFVRWCYSVSVDLRFHVQEMTRTLVTLSLTNVFSYLWSLFSQLKQQKFNLIYTPAVLQTLTPPPRRPSNDGTELKRTNLPLNYCVYEHWQSSHLIINFISCVDLWVEIINQSEPRRRDVTCLNTGFTVF